MTNEELLEKMQDLFKLQQEETKKTIRAEIEGESKLTRKNFTTELFKLRMETSNSIGEVADRLKNVEISNNTIDMKAELINKNLEQSIQDNANFFNETWLFFDKLKKQFIKRFELIEKYLNLPQDN